MEEKLFDVWASRNPQWETKYEGLIDSMCDKMRGVNSLREARGKIFGASYESYIIAFFIGLYYNQRKPLTTNSTKRKTFGWPIMNWGNIDKRNDRKPYPKIREYMFVALVARTDVDFIALDKGEITVRKAVDMLIQTMEEYANFGYSVIKDKMEDDPTWIYRETAFLEVFLGFDAFDSTEDIEPESLD